MGKRTLSLFAIIFVGVVIIALVSNQAIAPGNQPPLNVNVQNTPLQVEVTNPSGMPIATNCLTAMVSGKAVGIDLVPEVLIGALDWEEVEIGNKTVVFTGGVVSGGIVFTSGDGVGAAPGSGAAVAITASGDWIDFALPLNSIYRVENVTKIRVHAWTDSPKLYGAASYAYTVEATVHWLVEEC